MLNRPVGTSAAIDAIRKRSAYRVHADTPALSLLGIEDRFQARIEWKQRVGRQVLESDTETLANARHELKRRPKSEIEDAVAEFRRRNKIWSYFPDTGPFRRELYRKHMEVVSCTLDNDEILMCSANRIGKSQLGAYCVACWTTGRYPRWWHGRVFNGPVTAWIVNKTAKDTRDINEAELLGPPGNEQERGTGFLPAHLITRCTPKPGTPHAFEFINVEHVSGQVSYIVSKSYDQGREAFQGRNVPVIWNDEEVGREIYDEEMLRIMTCSGLILTTFTPINGLTEMTAWFMESAGLSIESMRNADAPEVA